MIDTEIIRTYDNVKREITTKIYIIHYDGSKRALVWEGKEPYPVSLCIAQEEELNGKT